MILHCSLMILTDVYRCGMDRKRNANMTLHRMMVTHPFDFLVFPLLFALDLS